MQYRRDIDGLRALAVLPVLFYHGGVSLFSGGYVGVDIFFVISGFLITSVIIEEVRTGTFTISNFYLRRIKRIFPVLFFILLVTALLCAVFQMPYDFRNFGKSLSSAVFFGSNIYFKKQMGYFTDAAETKPLLHTWSLSVEEQFYIFYPLVLMLIARYLSGKHVRYVAIMFVLSLAYSVYIITDHPADAFYLLPSRAWELFLGALLALGAFSDVRNKVFAELLAFTGLLMIGWSIVLYSESTQFPGVAALLPCVGAFLLIYTGRSGTTVSRLLSLKPFVYIGLISYSLYLWHWPLLSFFNSYRPVLDISETDAQLVRLGILLLSFMLSILTYRYVEKPFRRMKPENLKVFFSKTALIMTAICLVGGVIYWSDGIPQRLPKAVAQIDNGHDEMHKMGNCKDNGRVLSYEKMRRIGAKGAEPEFIVIGDSHAGAIFPGFDEYGKKKGIAGILVSKNGLVPISGFGHKYKNCYSDMVEQALDIVTEQESIRKVILVSRWVIHVEGQKLGGKIIDVYDRDHNIIPRDKVFDFMREHMVATVDRLQKAGKEVYLLTGVPEVDINVPNVMAMSEYLKSSFGYDSIVDMRPTRADHYEYQKSVLALLRSVAKSTGATVVHTEDALLNGNRYDLTSGGYSNYMDGNHLAFHGAVTIVDHISRQIFGG